MNHEQVITNYLQSHYSDERLSWLLAHAQSGKLSLFSCCCFIGITTADHPLRGKMDKHAAWNEWHYIHAHTADVEWVTSHPAEWAFKCLGKTDEERRAKIIPLIEAEIKRREQIALRDCQNQDEGLLVSY